MKAARRIEQLVDKFCAMNKSRTTISSEMDERTLNDTLSEYDKSMKSLPTLAGTHVGRGRKLAAAALIIIAVTLGLYLLIGLNSADVVWGEVVTHIDDVDYVHMYYFKSRGKDFFRQFEGWHAHGKTLQRVHNGDTFYDDGQKWQRFNAVGILVARTPSVFPDGRTFLERMSGGLLSDNNEQFNEQIPARVGDDFLIYRFDPRPSESDWMESIVITVGRNSLLPIQAKFCSKDGDYDLLIFDYEAPEKPTEFFELPEIGPPNGTGEVTPDGEEVKIDITGAPGLKNAIVRLHSESVNDAGETSFSLNVKFITEEGFRSHTMDIVGFRADEAKMCGTGGIGGFEGWPDGKYRNIRFSPWLKPTDTPDKYIVEIRCRVFTKTD
ncbi:MAG: hypothetical protein JSW59_16530 [Phycisphaerales bacterium]|nr:MAG: hypothetical protein JSW59_16530 [Phycisphaerales bacterium]